MKRILKILLASVMLFLTICSPAGAYRVKKQRDDYFYPKKEIATVEKGIYFEDFTKSVVGEKPSGITTSIGNQSDMYISRTDVDGKTKNVLTFEHKAGALSLVKKIGKSEYVTAEVRFRRVNKVTADSTSFVISARSNSKEVFRIYLNSGTNRILINSSLGTHSFAGANKKDVFIEDDVWNTFGIYINTKEHKAGFKVQSDTLKSYTLTDNVDIRYNTSEGIAVGSDLEIDPQFTYIDDIRIYTGSYTGTFEIDYINIDNKDKPYVLNKPKPAPLTLPTTLTPGERLVPDVINVLVNGKVTYYPYYPVYDSGKYFAEYKKTLDAFGYSAFIDNNVITAKNENSEIIIHVSNNTMNVDGKDYSITPIKQIKNYILIPVTEIAEILGYAQNVENNVIYLSKD